MVSQATTLTMEPVQAEGWAETAGVLAVLEEQDTGAGAGQLIAGITGAAGGAIGGPYGSILSGAGQLAGALVDGKAPRGGALGGAIGQLAGGAIGAVFGGPAGSALGSTGGQLVGNLIGGAIDSAPRKPKPNRAQARKRARQKATERAARARANQPPLTTTATTSTTPPPAAPPPATPPPKQPASTAQAAPPPPAPPQPPPSETRASSPAQAVPKREAPAAPPAPPAPAPYPPLLLGFRDNLTEEQRARLDQAIRDKRGVNVLKDLLAERSAVEEMEATLAQKRDAPPPPIDPPPFAATSAAEAAAAEEEPEYDDAAAPPAKRPRPRLHIGLVPLHRWQLEALLVRLPALRKLDARLLRAVTGHSSTVRDTAGIDPATRTYHAEPGETALGIAKKLTGKAERAADLLAANPGHRDGDPVWRIPPGWIHVVTTGEETQAPDTGATSRLYVVQKNDTPIGIATRSGAKAVRPKWWSELKAANPHIPVTDNGNNFERFFAGDQLWIPDEWPPSPMFSAGGASPSPSAPPIPVPGPLPNTTMDPGVPLQAQMMLGFWARSNGTAANPADYGSTPADYTGTTTTRFTSALASFQTWNNAKTPNGTKLRTDGVLDGPTYQALHAATVGTLTQPGPGAVPWAPPQPQAPPAQPAPQGGQNPPGAVPGIHGGLLQLGGWSGPLGPGALPIPVQPPGVSWLQGVPSAPPPPAPTPGPAIPSHIIGTQVPGWPPGATYAADSTIYYNGQPVPVGQQVPGMASGVLWALGGLMTYQGKPYIPAQPVPGMQGFVYAPYIPGVSSSYPWIPEAYLSFIPPYNGAQSFPQQQPPGQPPKPQPPQEEPKKDSGSGVAIPLLLAAATMAFS